MNNPAFRLFIAASFFLFLGHSTSFSQQLTSAPIQGHTTSSSFKLWLMTQNTDQVRLKLMEGDKVVKAKSIDVSAVSFWKDHAPITVEFDRLKPATSYQVSVALDGEEMAERYEFSTFQEGSKDEYSFSVGSCALLVTGGWKLLWRDKTKIFRSLAQTDTDFMLWLGDNVYLLLGEWEKADRMQKKFTKVRTEPAINDFLRTRPNYATWDDHDYGPDNSDGTFENRDATLANFQSFWPNPDFGTADTKGVFSHFRYQDSEYFLLDGRYHRVAKGFQTMLGDAQMEWLKERLKDSEATFKFIVNGSQVTNMASNHECLAQYPQYEELMGFLRDEKITGVVMMSGDRHFTELLRTDRDDLYPIYEFTNSPLMSPVRKKVGKSDDPEFGNPQRVSGTLITERNFGSVTIGGSSDDRSCTFRSFDQNGKQLWEQTIYARDLDF